MLPLPQLVVDAPSITGEVVHIDRFGNLITSIGHLRWSTPERLTLIPAFGQDKANVLVSAENASLTVGDQKIVGVKHSYSEAERGGLLMLVGSSAYIEISVNQGSAAKRLDAHVGDRVEMKIGDINAAVHY
jgi:S-adenosylmethionine hydrolase